MSDAPDLDLSADVLALTRALVDVPSPSGHETALADAVETALRALGGLEVERLGDCVLARTNLDLPTRVVLAGHLDTVPIADNVPSDLREADGVQALYGCGTSDMKSGDAVMLRLAGRFGVAGAPAPAHDLTFVFYDNEEVEHAKNGLGRVAREKRGWLYGDLAVLMEPTDGEIEGGCQGTLKARLEVKGRRAHSARSWLGVNAIHGLTTAVVALGAYRPREVQIDGLTYREGLNAVGISGGVAGNVIPDAAVVTVNYGPGDPQLAHTREEHVIVDRLQPVEDALVAYLSGSPA